MIKHFTKDQRRIYEEWKTRQTEEMPQQVFEKEMANLEKMFAAMCNDKG